MGYVNFIIIKDWKVAIEVPRSVNELEDYENDTIERAIHFDCDKWEIREKNHKDLTVSDMKNMIDGLDIASGFSEMYPEKFLLFWLNSRGVEYEIKSEYDFDAKESKFFIVRM